MPAAVAGWWNTRGETTLAVLRDCAASHTWVLKDPTGSLPCFTTTFRGVQVIFGNIARPGRHAQLFEFTINERYLRDRVLHGGIARSVRTQ